MVLAYHDVVERAPEGYEVSAGQLRRQLSRLLDLGLKIVPIHGLVERLEQGRSIDGLAVITFDDAFQGTATIGADVLEELEVPACVFVPSDALGGNPSWASGKPIADAPTIRELAARGFTIGSHSRSHPRLPQCPDQVLDAEVVGSRRELEDLTGRRVDVFAYPFGHVDQRTADVVERAGYRAAFTFSNDRVTSDAPLLRVPRLVMGSGLDRFRFLARVACPAEAGSHRI